MTEPVLLRLFRGAFVQVMMDAPAGGNESAEREKVRCRTLPPLGEAHEQLDELERVALLVLARR